MKEIADLKFIRLNGEAVYAILADHKCQMRFALNRQDITGGRMTEAGFVADVPDDEASNGLVIKPPYVVGDVLAVKETWAKVPGVPPYVYRATCYDGIKRKWRQSNHMPNDAARIFLLVTGMKVERLQDITIGDVEREGIFLNGTLFPVDEFIKLWDSGLAKTKRDIHAWKSNPWVYAVLFKRICKEDAMSICGKEDF